LEKIKIARRKDKEVVRIVKEMKKAKVKVLQNIKCHLHSLILSVIIT